MSDLTNRITAYLSEGGLWNPELAIHDSVRDLLIDCREALSAPLSETGEQFDGSNGDYSVMHLLAAHPTPKTNALIKSDRPFAGSEYAEQAFDKMSFLARTLERENAELRRMLVGFDEAQLNVGTMMHSLRSEKETAERLLAEARKDAEGMAKYLLSHCQPVVDGACKQCNPSGEYLIPDFVCGYHVAAALKEST